MALSLAVLASHQAWAAPSVPPPSGFQGETFVDPEGCAYHRFTLGGEVMWAEVLDEGGAPLCGLAPSRATQIAAMPLHRRGEAPPFPEPGRYAQIGLFLNLERADAFAAQLAAAGLPLLRQDFPRGGGRVQRVLYAGPFADAAAADAGLQVIRAVGFTDAFLWQHELEE